MNVTYSTTQNGKTYATVTTDKGTAMIRVEKREVMNASARGGAYKTEWLAVARGHKFRADTRKAALEAAVASLRARGFNL